MVVFLSNTPSSLIGWLSPHKHGLNPSLAMGTSRLGEWRGQFGEGSVGRREGEAEERAAPS